MVPGTSTPRGSLGIPPIIAYGSNDSSNSSASSYSFTGVGIGTADPTRYVIVGVTWRQSGGARTVSTVTVAGIAASNLVTAGSDAAGAELWIAAVPTGTTGTVAVTFNSSVQRCAVVTYAATGDFSLTPYDSAYVSNTSGATTTTINIPEGGFCVAMFHNNNDGSTVTWTGLTENTDDSYGNSGTQRFSSAIAVTMSAETGRTITANGSGGTNERRMAVASFAPD